MNDVAETPTLRAGLIGLGSMGRHHARNLAALDGVELVAVVDPGGDRFNASQGKPVLNSVDELIDAGVDYVMVAAPTGLHEEIALQLADAGIHTMVEKPLAATLEGGKRIVAAFKARDLVGAVGHVERFNPALQEMRRRIQAGELGDIYSIATRRQGPFPARIADVGVVKDLATHDIDLTAWLGGAGYASITGEIANRSGREHEDMVFATGRLTNGVIVNHVVNWLSPFKERTTTVIGEKGSFVADTGSSDLTFFANGTIATEWDQIASFRGVTEGDMVRYAFTKREPLRSEHEAFRDAVLGRPAEIVTMEQGLHTLEVVEQILGS